MSGYGWTDEVSIFFFNDTATTEIYTLSLHDALPICPFLDEVGADEADVVLADPGNLVVDVAVEADDRDVRLAGAERSEEHTSELQSRQYLVCRLLLEKKKKYNAHTHALNTHT